MIGRSGLRHIAVAYVLSLAGSLAGASILLRAGARSAERLAGIQ